MATHPNPINEVEKTVVREFLDTRGAKLNDLPGLVKLAAETRAMELNRVVTVTTDTGVTHTAAPPNRRDDIKRQAKNETIKPEDLKDDWSVRGASLLSAFRTVGTPDGTDDGDSPAIGGAFSNIASAFKSGAERGLGGILPSMEAIMLNIPSAALGKFVKGLPAAFQALTPPGALSGIVGAVVNTALGGGTTSLNNLVKTVAGAAVGVAAGQALRSVTNGIGIPAVSGLAGSLGAIALNRVAQSSTAAVPLNIARNINPRATIGNTPQSNAVLATVAGTVGAAAFRGVTQGIPVGPNLLGLSANVALRSVGAQLNIPTPVLGLAANFASGAISSIIGGAVGGRVPILSSNLSLPLTGGLSGIAQSISANVAQTLIPSAQLQGLLPQNLQNAIPRVPPRLYSPYIQNRVGVNRGQAKELYPSGPRTPQEERKSTLGALQPRNGLIPPELPISKNFTVADVSLKPRKEQLSHARGNPGVSIDQIYENLKFLAENVLEPVFAQFPRNFCINSGLRNKAGDSWHTKGLAVDLQWEKEENFSAMAEKAEWVYRNIKPLRELLLETKGPANASGFFWLHVAVLQGQTSPSRVATWYVGPGGGAYNKIPYRNGFQKA